MGAYLTYCHCDKAIFLEMRLIQEIATFRFAHLAMTGVFLLTRVKYAITQQK